MAAWELSRLLDVERAGWDALCSGDGARFYGDLMTDDALMVLVDGTVLDRGQVVASLDQAPTWESYEITEPRLAPAGDDAAALVYRATARRPGEEPFDAVMSSVYRRLDGRPRLVLYQQTTATH